MNIFYTTGKDGDKLLLDEIESHHCVKVLRTRVGGKVFAVDGIGGFYKAILIEANPKKCILGIESEKKNYNPLPYDLHIGIAPTKSIDRFEWFLEKATEIGVSSITPLLCERSERKHLRPDRLEKVIVSAMKQSMKAYKPVIYPITAYNDWLNSELTETRLIAHCIDGDKPKIWQMDIPDSLSISIGPEGDFSREEVDLAHDKGYKEISLGDYRLRTETAGIVACSAVYFNLNK
jgi:16S rRNA (uracil1498-N3)-methyltransferase